MAELHADSAPAVLAYAPNGRPRGVPWWAWLFVLAALVIRIAASLTRPADAASLKALPDQREYAMAGTMYALGVGMFFRDETFHDTLRAYRMPGYPALIAACPPKPFGTLRTVQLWQAAMDASSVLAVFLIGQRVATRAAATLAAVAVAVNPYLIYFSTLILSETTFTVVLTWGVWAILSRCAWIRLIGVIALLASVYVRPSAIGLGVVAAAYAFGRGLTPIRAIKNGFVAMVVATAVLVLLLTPWAVRNKAIFGRYVWLTTNDGFSAYDAFNPHADGSSDQAWFRADIEAQEDKEAQRFDEEREKTNGRVETVVQPDGIVVQRSVWHDWMPIHIHDELGRSERLSAMAWDYARTHPLRDVELAFLKLGRFWSPVPLSADFGGRWLYVVVGGVYCVPLFVFAAIGLVKGGLGRRTTFTLLLPAIYFTAVHSVAVGSLRYRVPCDVPLAVLAAAGVVACLPKKATA